MNHWIMQFQSSDWLIHRGIWAITHASCSPNVVTVRVCSTKLKTSWKSVVFTNKVEKNSQYFMGVFNKAIIIIPLCLLLDMRMIIANLVLHTSLAICHRAVTKSRGLGMFLGYYECAGAPATFIGNKSKTEPKELPFCAIALLLIA